MTEDTPRIIGADEVRVGQRVSFAGTSYEGWIVDEGLLDIVLKAAATGYVFLLSDAPTEDLSFSISSAAEMFTDPTEDGASGGPDSHDEMCKRVWDDSSRSSGVSRVQRHSTVTGR